MLLSLASGRSQPERQRLYRRLMVGVILVGVAVALVLRSLAFPLVGELVYWIAIGTFFAIWFASDVELFDERDAAMERRASHLAIHVVGAVLVVGASLARILPRVTDVTVPDPIVHGLYAYVGLFAVWIAAYLFVRYRA